MHSSRDGPPDWARGRCRNAGCCAWRLWPCWSLWTSLVRFASARAGSYRFLEVSASSCELLLRCCWLLQVPAGSSRLLLAPSLRLLLRAIPHSPHPVPPYWADGSPGLPPCPSHPQPTPPPVSLHPSISNLSASVRSEPPGIRPAPLGIRPAPLGCSRTSRVLSRTARAGAASVGDMGAAVIARQFRQLRSLELCGGRLGDAGMVRALAPPPTFLV